ncbi:restriction endonuclease subunit S [Candidatus Poriferisodalis sp.]|uniref:restriction endonuclease subunit S n=1 Tax=Candidatus Poriferisodalis sp. TaxID=3101277 RepID=UPI003D0E2B38
MPYFLRADQFHGRALDISVGSLSPTINWKTHASEIFLFPDKTIQEEISTAMEGFENYINALTHAIESVRTLEGAIVDEVSREGSPSTLGELVSNGGIQIGPFGSQLHAHEYVDEGLPVVMPADLTADGLRYDRLRRITEQTAERLAKHRVRTGDILLPRRGDLNKRALINEHEAVWLCGTGSVRVRLDDLGDAPLVVRLLR